MYIFTLGEEAKEYAEKELGENEETRIEALKQIRNWLKDNQEINARTDDRSILDFLRACKFNIERTKVKLRNYYALRTDKPEWFTDRNPELPAIAELNKLHLFLPLRELYDNKLVVIVRFAAQDPLRHTLDEVFKVGMMVLDIASKECENSSVFGVVGIFDMEGLSFAHVRQLTPSVIKSLVYVWENYHCRPKQMEIINAPFFLNVIINIFKTFMSEKLRKRLRVHFSGLESLHKVVDSKILPEEYGGCGDNLNSLSQYWYDKLVSNKQWLKKDEKYKIINNSD